MANCRNSDLSGRSITLQHGLRRGAKCCTPDITSDDSRPFHRPVNQVIRDLRFQSGKWPISLLSFLTSDHSSRRYYVPSMASSSDRHLTFDTLNVSLWGQITRRNRCVGADARTASIDRVNSQSVKLRNELAEL